jgi:serine/threonine protein kinase
LVKKRLDANELDRIARLVCQTQGYGFVGFVGAGAFKRTYCVQVSDGNSVALKVYSPGFSRERTEREIDAMKRCSHVGVSRLIDIFTVEEQALQYTVTTEEFLPDGNLAAEIARRGLFKPSDVRALGARLIDALSHISSLGLVHRDIKPENIMFRGEAPVIVDFGLVRDLTASSLTQTWLANGPGTPFFASPEQLRNQKSLIDWRSDQFSLGVTLAICAFGYHPFARNASAGETIDLVMKRTGPDSKFVADAEKAGLSALVRMVSVWPVERFRTVVSLAVAWEAQNG